MQSIKDVIGPHEDIPAPGMATLTHLIVWICHPGNLNVSMQFKASETFHISMRLARNVQLAVHADMNTDGRVMSWFFDEYSKFEGFSPGVVTGKVS